MNQDAGETERKMEMYETNVRKFMIPSFGERETQNKQKKKKRKAVS
jgi:hypothetical protein